MSLNRDLRNRAREDGTFNARMIKISRVVRRVFPNGNIVDYDSSAQNAYISLEDDRLEERIQLYASDGSPYDKQPKLKNLFEFLARHPDAKITRG